MHRRRRPRALIVGVALLAAACGADDADPADDALDPPAVTVTAAQDTASTTTAATGSAASGTTDETGTDTEARWPEPLESLDPAAPARWTVEVLGTAPHDPEAFTQGLEPLGDDRLLESTGRRGESDIRIVDPTTGEVEQLVPLEDEEFGEGLTIVGDTVIQLTFEEEIARRWTLPDLEPLPSFSYSGQGWGLCLLDDRLAMTDGSSLLEWRDPETFEVIDAVEVVRNGQPIVQVNELECLDGHVMANIWKTSEIIVIRPDGAVVATIDASELVDTIDSGNPNTETLNGIAAHPDGTFSLTGKLWPTLFVVRVVAG